jgi:hypothetical protein
METSPTVTTEENDLPQTSEILGLSDFLDSIPVGNRRGRFQAIAQGMLDANRPIRILETGCMRQSRFDGPEGDGCSSLVWDYVAKRTKGGFISIDINPENVEYTRSKLDPAAQVFCCESVRFLSAVDRISPLIDLLYLDSMDWEGSAVERGLAALHHAAELSAVWPWLNDGAIIAIDDCHGEYAGKHAIVKRFFESIGVAPLVDDFIHVWRKPKPTAIELVLSDS